MHLNVLLNGRLVGLGHQAECKVMARKTVRPETSEVLYGDPVIIDAPNELPEGEYSLFFENVSTSVLHKGILWMPAATVGDKETNRAVPASPSKTGLGALGMARRMLRDRRKHI